MNRPHWKKIAHDLKNRLESDGYTVALEHEKALVWKEDQPNVYRPGNPYAVLAGPNKPKPWWTWPWGGKEKG